MKFKNTKKEASSKGGSPLGGKKAKSPSNSRVITESSKFSFPKLNPIVLLKIYRGSLKVFIVLVFLLAAFIVGMDLKENLISKENIDFQREALIRDLKFWEDFISKHQDYRDAYFQASILEYRLGNTSKAKKYAEKGLVLDPNSKDGKKLKRFLVNK